MVEILVNVSVFVIVLSAIIYIIYCLYDYVLKRDFLKKYHIEKLPEGIKVRKHNHENNKNYYELKYPSWSVSKKDGTADRRVKNNSIIWKKSSLYVDCYLVSSKKPYELIEVVRYLRCQGIEIVMCKEEKEKYHQLLEKKKAFCQSSHIKNIVDYFSKKPTDFEKLYAKLYESMGYSVQITPPANDGGYDLVMIKKNEKTIVECKCYSINHKIGRPSIQKIVGANNVALADHIIFITTSDYTAAAILYAKEVGVELIDGTEFMKLLEKYGFIEPVDIEVGISEYQLEKSDLYSYVPNDIYKRFF